MNIPLFSIRTTGVAQWYIYGLATLLMSCESEITDHHNDSGTRVAVQFVAPNIATPTRTTTFDDKTVWTAGDIIGVYMVEHSALPNSATTYANRAFKAINGNSDNTSFETKDGDQAIYYPNDGSMVDFIAYYPHYALPAGTLTFPVNTPLTASTELLWCKSDNTNHAGYTKGSDPVRLTFQHKLSKLVVNLTPGESITNNELTGATVSLRQMHTKATFNVSDGSITVTNTDALTKGTIDAKGYDNPTISHQAILIPQSKTANPNMSALIMLTNGKQFSWPMTGVELKSGQQHTYTLILNGKNMTIGIMEAESTVWQWGASQTAEIEQPTTMNGDVEIVPSSGKASEWQSGENIEMSFDGLYGESHYHSRWNGQTEFPVTLEYFFNNPADIDYIVYHTRSGNGNFGRFDLYYMTSGETSYKSYSSFDFHEQDAASRISFSSTMNNITAFKFVVHSGRADYVSCAEMDFFGRAGTPALHQQLLRVFTDLSCSELKAGVQQADIQALPAYFAALANAIRNNLYDPWEKRFRIQDYAPYSIPEEWAKTLVTKVYGRLDNPTGVTVQAGEELIVLVGPTYGNAVSLVCSGEEGDDNAKRPDVNGDTYFISEGYNKIKITRPGLLFLMYNTDLTSPNAKPIRVHIPSGCGTVNGYFDQAVDQTNQKYQETINRSTYKYFCVKGRNIMFYFHREKLRAAIPLNIVGAIGIWDTIIGWQHEVLGITHLRPSQFNNHILAISPEDSYMWASDYRIGFNYNTFTNILSYDRLMAVKDHVWGPSHEIGHVHQKVFNWASSSESSNNLFSNISLYKLGKYATRGSELSQLAQKRFVDKNVWCTMQSSGGGEDPELHMRMFWQLWYYYHACGFKTDFWPKFCALLRENPINTSNPGADQLMFAKMASRAANENLTDFFKMWGFLDPIDITMSDYGTYTYTVTSGMINEAKQYMANYPNPRHAFYYLEDRKNGQVGIDNYRVGDVGYYTQFKNNTKITQQISCTRSGRTIYINNGSEAVAFELRRNNETLYFSNFYTFTVPDAININGATVYAVQADGQRIPLE